MCHTEENYLKHVTLLNRFKIVFLLNRDIGLRETYLKPNIWVLESPGLGSRALKCRLLPLRLIEVSKAHFVIFTQHEPSLLRTRGVYIYILSNKLFSFAGLFQHHLHPVAANRTQREVKQHGHHTRYYCTYYCISDAKKRKQKTTKNTSYSSSICLRATQASNKVRPSLSVNLTHLHP